MAYNAWSVVFGEQPTAAKWNQLGTNDAGFRDGSNIQDDAIIARHVADDAIVGANLLRGQVYRRQGGNSTDPSVVGTSNYDWSAQDLLIQIGFANATTAGDHSITFPVAFSEKPWVMIGASSARTVNAWARCKQESVTTTTLAGVSMFGTDGNLKTTEAFTWIAIGKA